MFLVMPRADYRKYFAYVEECCGKGRRVELLYTKRSSLDLYIQTSQDFLGMSILSRPVFCTSFVEIVSSLFSCGR